MWWRFEVCSLCDNDRHFLLWCLCTTDCMDLSYTHKYLLHFKGKKNICIWQYWPFYYLFTELTVSNPLVFHETDGIIHFDRTAPVFSCMVQLLPFPALRAPNPLSPSCLFLYYSENRPFSNELKLKLMKNWCQYWKENLYFSNLAKFQHIRCYIRVGNVR